MHILMWSDKPGDPSAYGQQLEMVAPLMVQAGYKVSIFAPRHNGRAVLWPDKRTGVQIRVVGGRDTLTPSGFNSDMLDAHVEALGCDVVISTKDPYSLGPHLATLSVPWMPLVPVDVMEYAEGHYGSLRHAFRCFSPSRHGVEILKQGGVEATYIPHGIDLDIFKPGSKAEAREKLHWPQDHFIALFVGDNAVFPSRKNFENILGAWAIFIGNKENVSLALHTDFTPDRGGIAIDAYTAALHIPSDTLYAPDPYVYVQGYPASHMALQYQAADVVLNPSLGGGFELAVLEAQACGCPVITTNVTAMKEMTEFGSSILCDPHNGDIVVTGLGGPQFRASTFAILSSLEHIYAGRHMEQKRREAGLKLARQFEYRKVFKKYWVPFLKQLESWIVEAHE